MDDLTATSTHIRESSILPLDRVLGRLIAAQRGQVDVVEVEPEAGVVIEALLLARCPRRTSTARESRSTRVQERLNSRDDLQAGLDIFDEVKLEDASGPR